MEDKNKICNIKNIIEREIEKELVNKQNEVTEISDKIKNILRNLDILKYIVAVNCYDQNPALTVKKGQDEENDEDKIQTQIHPCVKKLLPFHSNYERSLGDLGSHTYETRNNKKSNSTECKPVEVKKVVENNENSIHEKSNNSNNIKIPQYIPPVPSANEVVGTINSARGSVSKDCYRIVVGNISKWISPDIREDNSTHKWMVYIRNRNSDKDIFKLIKKVRYFLHESYKPHDIIDVTSPPFHLTRRGWGEFPIRVQLHFIHPLNKPVDIIHNLKLDMTCSGVQMLGSESVLEVVLYQNNSLVFEKNVGKVESNVKSDTEKIKVKEQQDIFDDSLLTNLNGIFPMDSEVGATELEDNSVGLTIGKPDEYLEDEKLNFTLNEEINMAIYNSRKFLLDRRKIMKIIEIEHSYLKSVEKQVDKNLNKFTNSILKLKVNKNINDEKVCQNGTVLDSVQFNHIINKKNQDRLNKMEIGCSMSEEEILKNLKSVANKLETETQSKYCMKVFRHMYLVNTLQRAQATKFKNVESLVKWFFQRWPVVTKLASDPTYKILHPYSCPSLEEFFTYNIGKQRSAEWFRAKAIQKILQSLKPIIPIKEEIWTTKQILLWSRFHGYSPISFQTKPVMEPTDINETRIKKEKSIETSSDSDEGSSDNPSKRLKTNNFFFNGLHSAERRKNYKKSRRKEYVEKTIDRHKNYRDCNTFSESSDCQRYGTTELRSLDPVNLISEIEVIEVEKNSVRESPTKKKPVNLSVITTSSESMFNKFVSDSMRQIGIKVVEEEIIPGVNCDSVSRVVSQCAFTFLDELLRKSFAQAWLRNGDRCPNSLELNDILAALIEYPQFDIFTNRGLGTLVPTKTEV